MASPRRRDTIFDPAYADTTGTSAYWRDPATGKLSFGAKPSPRGSGNSKLSTYVSGNGPKLGIRTDKDRKGSAMAVYESWMEPGWGGDKPRSPSPPPKPPPRSPSPEKPKKKRHIFRGNDDIADSDPEEERPKSQDKGYESDKEKKEEEQRRRERQRQKEEEEEDKEREEEAKKEKEERKAERDRKREAKKERERAEEERKQQEEWDKEKQRQEEAEEKEARGAAAKEEAQRRRQEKVDKRKAEQAAAQRKREAEDEARLEEEEARREAEAEAKRGREEKKKAKLQHLNDAGARSSSEQGRNAPPSQGERRSGSARPSSNRPRRVGADLDRPATAEDISPPESSLGTGIGNVSSRRGQRNTMSARRPEELKPYGENGSRSVAPTPTQVRLNHSALHNSKLAPRGPKPAKNRAISPMRGAYVRQTEMEAQTESAGSPYRSPTPMSRATTGMQTQTSEALHSPKKRQKKVFGQEGQRQAGSDAGRGRQPSNDDPYADERPGSVPSNGSRGSHGRNHSRGRRGETLTGDIDRQMRDKEAAKREAARKAKASPPKASPHPPREHRSSSNPPGKKGPIQPKKTGKKAPPPEWKPWAKEQKPGKTAFLNSDD